METGYSPISDKEKCIFFALGRNAMYAACKILGLKEGDEVLTPAFDCDGSLGPFRVLGLGLKFIRSDAHTFSIDISDIKKNIGPRTKLIHIINHFGMPQPWDDIMALRKEADIPILEDNAYSLFSKFNGKPFGTFGDMAIFSLRKNLPLIDGGALRINNPLYRSGIPAKKPLLLYPVDLINRFSSHFDTPPPPLYSDPKKGYHEWRLRDIIEKDFACDYLRPMSIFSKFKLSRFSQADFLDICERKIRYYKIAAEGLQGVKNIDILWPVLPEGAVPFSLSFLVRSSRDDMLYSLRKKYEVMAWPTLPGSILKRLNEFPEVEILGRQLIQLNLPVDRIRSSGFPQYLDNAVSSIRSIAEKL